MAIPISEKRKLGCESFMLSMRGEYGNRIPESTIDTIAWWIYYGHKPGSFVEAVLCDRLSDACRRADVRNRDCIYDIVCLLENHAPRGCWGSTGAYLHWPDEVKAAIEMEHESGA